MRPRALAHHRRDCGPQSGYTLIELLVVLTILLVVLGGLTVGFASMSRAEVDQNNRASDEQSARQSLDRMRQDVHCAYAVQPAQPTVDALGNPTGGYNITFTETPPSGNVADGCPKVVDDSSAVQWCTVQISPTRWQLLRSAVNCPLDADFQVDYVTTANIWPATTCTAGRFPTVAIDMPVNRNPTTRPGRTYRLTDQIALRNAPIC